MSESSRIFANPYSFCQLITSWVFFCNLSNTKVFDHLFKHLEIRQKFSAARCFFNCLLESVFRNGLKHSLVFDILLLLKLKLRRKRMNKTVKIYPFNIRVLATKCVQTHSGSFVNIVVCFEITLCVQALTRSWP